MIQVIDAQYLVEGDTVSLPFGKTGTVATIFVGTKYAYITFHEELARDVKLPRTYPVTVTKEDKR